MKSQKVIIAGGGIAGLTCAIALEKKGFETEIYEAAPKLEPVGAGIVIAANALKVMTLLGMGDEIKAAGRKMLAAQILDQKGKTILVTPEMKIDGRIPVVSHTILRSALHEILARHYGKPVRTGSRIVAATQDAKSVTAVLENGETVSGHFLVAADGIHSLIRKQLLPESKERYTGFTCWRGLTDTIPKSISHDFFTETWGTNGRFGIVPLGGTKVYWYATGRAERNEKAMRLKKIKDLKEQFAQYHQAVSELLSVTKDEHVICNDLIDLEPISRFDFGRIVLIGDAGHATTPNLGQGACQAMEDGIVLATCLAENPSPQALKKFTAIRIPRTTRVVNESWRFGKISENKSAFFAGLRNGLLRMSPKGMAMKQFRFLFDIEFPGWE